MQNIIFLLKVDLWNQQLIPNLMIKKIHTMMNKMKNYIMI